MAAIFRTRGAARVGVATLALALQLATPLAPTGLAETASAATASATTASAATATSPAATQSAPPTGNGTNASGCHDTGPADYPVAGGWFYTEQARGLCIQGHGPDRNRGYMVVDDDKGAFWTEFRRYGGVDVLGYPVSQPYHYPVNSDGGYWYQAFERGVLQWRPEAGRADMANVFEQFTEQGLDDDLAVLGIPAPKAADKSSSAVEIDNRMGWITEPRFLARYFFDPVGFHSSEPDRDGQTAFATQEQAWTFFGLPQSMPERVALLGPARVGPDQHIERVSLYPLVHSFMALLVLPLLVLSGVMFATPAVCTAAIVKAFEQMFYYITLAITPMFMFSGIFFPPNRLPHAVQWAIWLTPLYHVAHLSRSFVLGRPTPDLLVDVAWILVFTLVALLFPARLIRRKLLV